MTFQEFDYEVSARVTFTREEAQDIFDCSVNHYDLAVRQAARGGAYARRDGFIYEMYRSVQTDPNYPVKLTFRELDTMKKALEMHTNAELHDRIGEVLDRINAEVRRLLPEVQ